MHTEQVKELPFMEQMNTYGANPGASFNEYRESLVGFQISDNMRGVDLL